MGNPPVTAPADARGIAKAAQPPTKVFVRVVTRSGEPVPGVVIFAENLRDSPKQRTDVIQPVRDANGRYTHHLVWEIRADDFASGTEVPTKDKDGKDIRVLKRTLDVKARKDGFGPPPPTQQPGSKTNFSTFATAEARVVKDLLQGTDLTVELQLMDVRLGRLADPHKDPDWTNTNLKDIRARALFGDISAAGAKPDFAAAFTRLAFLHKVGQITLTREPQFNGADLVVPASRSQRVSFKGIVAEVEFFVNFGSKATVKVKRVPGQPPEYIQDKRFFKSVELQNLDLRNAVGLYRLCAQLRAQFGITELHHVGIGSGSGGAANCHNIGTAVDFAAVRIPRARIHPLAVDPFLLHVSEDWALQSVPNQTDLNAAKAKGLPTPPSSGFNPGNDQRDLVARPQQWDESVRSTEYRLDSLIIHPLPLDATDIQKESFALRKAILDASRNLFRFVFEFAAREYSGTAAGSTCGPGCFSPGEVAVSPRMDGADAIMNADYPNPDGKNANGSSQNNGRQAHFTHVHYQIGPTDDAGGI